MCNTIHILFNILLAVHIHLSTQCPHLHIAASKAVYKSGELHDSTSPITLEKIKAKLKESEIFDAEDPHLDDRERKELNKLFEAVEIMMTSRNRQPPNVQNMFTSMRLVERAVKKQLKEGQISETLAAKFHWEKICNRPRREPAYVLDKTTNMRIFNMDAGLLL